MKPKPSLARLRKLRCLLMDVDGVLTDGKLHFTSDGHEFKTFDVQDGHGIAMAQRAGLVIGFVSGRPSEATTKRAADLGVKIVLQRPANKMEMVEEIKQEHGYQDDELAFIGDELVDLPVLRRVGFAVAVPNAMDEVKEAAHYITDRNGGDGAVREIIELILKAQGSWAKVIAKYMTMLAAAIWMTTAVTADTPPVAPGTNEPAGFIEKFEVPERDANGNLKWKLMGDRARIRADGQMDVSNMRAEFYSSNKVEMVFSSPACTLDRINNRAVTDAPIRIERTDMLVTGVGADWSAESSSFIIRSNVHVVLTGRASLSSPKEKSP